MSALSTLASCQHELAILDEPSQRAVRCYGACTSKRKPPALSLGSILRLSSVLVTLEGSHLLVPELAPEDLFVEELLKRGLPNPTMPPPAPLLLLLLLALLLLEKPPDCPP